MRRVLVVSVHPDDETLGCGGTLLKHRDDGDETYCVHITSGNVHQAQLINCLGKRYGFSRSFSLDFSELCLDDISLTEIIPRLMTVFEEVKPEVVYVPNRSDAHSDHRRTFEALIACTKTFRSVYIKRILMYEVMSETDFSPMLPENMFMPTVFVDISDYFSTKTEIMKLFESELLPAPCTRSIEALEALHRYRGSQICCKYAEAFMLLKEIV